jgi:release factor glutamine methyltransferase
MTRCGDLVQDLTNRLRAAGVSSAHLDARLLVCHALGIERATLFAHPERALTPAELAAVEQLASRRLGREPMSHVLGRREFWSLDFRVTADTLDPRPDTETVVEAALDYTRDRTRPWRVLDFGTGSGCILLSLLTELPQATGVGVDIGAATLAVAADNARRLGLADRVRFVQGDWGAGVDGSFDLIVSNPPYIPDGDIAGLEAEVARFEPRRALAGGPDGLDCYRVLAPQIARLLVPGGEAALEVGLGQDPMVAALLEQAGLALRGVRRDLAGIARVVVAGKPRVEKV